MSLKGIWCISYLPEYKLIHYPAAFCYTNEDTGIIKIIDNNGVLLATLEKQWFNITWHYDKKKLLHECEKRLFQFGINESRRKYAKII